jgi:hypothetical protein
MDLLHRTVPIFPYDISAILSFPNLAGLPVLPAEQKRHSSKPSSSTRTATPSNRGLSQLDNHSYSGSRMNASSTVTQLEQQAEEWETFGMENGGEDMGATRSERSESLTTNEVENVGRRMSTGLVQRGLM